jgi:hypothetical protein
MWTSSGLPLDEERARNGSLLVRTDWNLTVTEFANISAGAKYRADHQIFGIVFGWEHVIFLRVFFLLQALWL